MRPSSVLLPQPAEQASHHLVGVGDLGEVGLVRVARGEGLGRVVGRVRIVEVDPGEEALRAHRFEPRERVRHHLVALLLDGAERDHLVLREIELVRVDVEALAEAPLALEHPGRDERSGREAALAQPLRERHLGVVEEEAAVVAHAVMGRDEPGEDRRVRRERERNGGGRVVEDDAVARERVDVRREVGAKAVAAQPIRAGRVERHDDQVQLASRGSQAREAGPSVGVGSRRAVPVPPEATIAAAASSAPIASHGPRFGRSRGEAVSAAFAGLASGALVATRPRFRPIFWTLAQRARSRQQRAFSSGWIQGFGGLDIRPRPRSTSYWKAGALSDTLGGTQVARFNLLRRNFSVVQMPEAIQLFGRIGQGG